MRTLRLVVLLLAVLAPACSSSVVLGAETGALAASAIAVHPTPAPELTIEVRETDAGASDLASTPAPEAGVDDEPAQTEPVGSAGAAVEGEAPATQPDSEQAQAFVEPLSAAFEAGDCYDTAEWKQAVAISCTESHLVEVLAIDELGFEDAMPFPGEQRIKILASDVCNKRTSFATWDLRSFTAIAADRHWPNEAQWASGDRSVVCVIVFDEPKFDSVAVLREAVEQAEAQQVADRRRDLEADRCYSEETLRRRPHIPVPCTTPHYAEVFYVGDLSAPAGTANPGVDGLVDMVVPVCERVFLQKMGVPLRKSSFSWTVFVPFHSWDQGGRGFQCVVTFDTPASAAISDLNALTHGERDSLYGALVGTCVYGNVVGDDRTIVDCSEPHNLQVIASREFDTSVPYPGDDAASAQALFFCKQALSSSGLDQQDRSWRLQTLYSAQGQWESGTATALCLALHRVPVTTTLFG